jgi:LysM repeat protein
LVVALAVVVLAGCGSGSPESSSAPTHLAIDATTGSPSGVLQPSQATLACGNTAEATGYLSNIATAACAFVRTGTIQQIAANAKSKQLCADIDSGPQSAHITGAIDGQSIDLNITRTDACGTNEWETLVPLLGDPLRTGVITSAPTTSAPPTTAGPISYPVKQGDTLTAIAKRFGVSVASIESLNHLADPDHLTAGQTLLIPPAPPVQLAITPAEGQAGDSFQLTLTGAHPSENVVFKIGAPDGTTFTGAAHMASTDGTVSVTYNSQATDSTGTYNVVATGDQNTTTQASFKLDPVGSSTTSTSTPPSS